MAGEEGRLGKAFVVFGVALCGFPVLDFEQREYGLRDAGQEPAGAAVALCALGTGGLTDTGVVRSLCGEGL